jgi:hypothetical protein
MTPHRHGRQLIPGFRARRMLTANSGHLRTHPLKKMATPFHLLATLM